MICKLVAPLEEMNLSQQPQQQPQPQPPAQRAGALCPASLCRLLRGIASQQQQQQQHGQQQQQQLLQPQQQHQQQPPAVPTNSTLAGQSFTIAAILGLKAGQHQHHQQQQQHQHQQHQQARLLAPTAAAYSECSSVVGGPSPAALRQKQRPSAQAHTSQSSHHSSKSKRVRTIFTPEQLERLEAEFERQQYMVGPERLYLAHALQLTEAQVKVWFQNRRIKWRKQHLELTQQRLAMARRQQLAEQMDAGSSSCSLPETA